MIIHPAAIIQRLAAEPDLVGPLLETFVICALFYLRTQSGQEVDLVLEDAAGQGSAAMYSAGSAIDFAAQEVHIRNGAGT